MNKRQVRIKDLPPPSPDAQREDGILEDGCKAIDMAAKDWPRISIVTPSYNQGAFIESTIRSVLLQGYPNLEYIIIDGGSTDSTLEIIRKYEPWISHWVSEPDSGMYEAINKGFAKSTGDIMAWSPTGDFYKPGALLVLGSIFRQLPEIEWLTSLYKTKCDESGGETACYPVAGFSRRAFRKGLNLPDGNPLSRYTIQQQSTFWRRSLWDKAGSRMEDSFKGAGDFELWCRFFLHADLYAVDQPVGVFRTHSGQTSVQHEAMMQREQQLAFASVGGRQAWPFEGWLRRSVLRKRPLRWLRKLPVIGFPAKIVHWHGHGQAAQLKVKRFV